ncbi:uncharacterized protein LOC141626933 [Silene latifolia]|uniref:uncharacterized protein LOC141626933 n=1 Tax=Silene latifolia TaxID=37657 RepID=UPI003D770814
MTTSPSSIQPSADHAVSPPTKKMKRAQSQIVQTSNGKPSSSKGKRNVKNGSSKSLTVSLKVKPTSNPTPPSSGKAEEPSIRHLLDDPVEADDYPVVDDLPAINESSMPLASGTPDLPATHIEKVIDKVEPSQVKGFSFNTQHMILEVERHAYLSMANKLRENLLKSSLDEIPAYEKECETFFEYLKSKNVDASVLRANVQNYLRSASVLQSMGGDYPMSQPTPSQIEEQIKVIKDRISSAASLVSQARKEVAILRGKLQESVAKEEQLKKELEEEGVKQQQLIASIAVADKEERDQVSVVETSTQEESSLEARMMIARQEVEKIEHVEKTFTESAEALKNLVWSP